jgi:hypothetical protein
MSFVEDMPADEVTGRTALAHEALTASQGVHMENVSLKRQFQRFKGTWGVLTLIAIVVGVGYEIRKHEDDFATKEHVAEHDSKIEQLEKWKEAKDEHERARDETMARMAKQLDDIYGHLIREKH